MKFIGDLHTLITADGEQFHIPDEENRFLFYAGYGAPPIEYLTRKSYKQNGETKIDYVLSPRNITVQLWKKEACSRLEYWQNRADLHDLLRPNRGGSIEFILAIPGGIKRAIKLDPTPGAQFSGDTDQVDWMINETLEFVAFDPVWYDPTAIVSAPSSTTSADLVFPITFDDNNIVFGTSGLQFASAITYTGTWVSYPTLTLTGPYTAVTIVNQQTGVMISLNVAISSGEQRIITLTPGALSVTDANGIDKFGDLGPLTNLVDFNIRPHPEIEDGIQTIQAIFTDGSPGTTAFSIEYNTRYYAI